ncbi:hypothetical protein PSPO01_10510 [Paraphaeosphaeria sporulosa]
MILKYALDSNDAGDIHIGLVKDGTTLVSPAFATLQKSRKINKELFEEAKYYMFSKNFRFIFDSRPLASHFTVHGLFAQDKKVSQAGIVGLLAILTVYERARPIPHYDDAGPAVVRAHEELGLAASMNRHLQYAPRLLDMAFPALRNLDIGLDVIDIATTPIVRICSP